MAQNNRRATKIITSYGFQLNKCQQSLVVLLQCKKQKSSFENRWPQTSKLSWSKQQSHIIVHKNTMLLQQTPYWRQQEELIDYGVRYFLPLLVTHWMIRRCRTRLSLLRKLFPCRTQWSISDSDNKFCLLPVAWISIALYAALDTAI